MFVSDLDHALAFYTDVLGFVKKRDIPMGDSRFGTEVMATLDDTCGNLIMIYHCGGS